MAVQIMKHATARKISALWDSGGSCRKLAISHTVSTHVNVTGLTSLLPGLSLAKSDNSTNTLLGRHAYSYLFPHFDFKNCCTIFCDNCRVRVCLQQ